MDKFSKEYERKLLKLIASYARTIQGIYHDAIIDVSLFSSQIKYKGQSFNLDSYPTLKKKFEEIIKKMHGRISAAVINSVNEAWDLSNKKNNGIVKDYTKDITLPKTVSDLVYNPNSQALKSFVERVEKGLNLSKRVWNLTKPYRFELEAGLTDGIAKGESAAAIASKLKRYLNEPDKLFRRVMDENGKLMLSKAAKAYHPGTGVYRSSFKNALRLSGTETNIAYNTADQLRWEKMDFVLGYEVKLSERHKAECNIDKHVCDICDEMQGFFDKDFKFYRFHPSCRCYSVPILMSKEDFSKVEDYNLGLSKKKPDIKYIKGIPAKAKNWIIENEERVKGWANTPYWWRFNKSFINDILTK